MTPAVAVTWHRPVLADKAHVFRDGESLCGMWFYRGEPNGKDYPRCEMCERSGARPAPRRKA